MGLKLNFARLRRGSANLLQGRPARLLARLMLAALLSTLAVALAVTGLLVTTAPPWLSLPLEPLSLLLLPGFAVEQFTSGPYTFHTFGVLRWNGAVYFVLFTLLLQRRVLR